MIYVLLAGIIGFLLINPFLLWWFITGKDMGPVWVVWMHKTGEKILNQ